MESLPDGYRVIFSLYLLEGYDHGEISQILGITESTSKTQFMKAKLKMKELLIKNHERPA
jgi:DNA-directed RNA polymerase specialized sigma24 family protein